MDITDGHALRARYAETFGREGESHPLRRFEQYRLVKYHREQFPDVGALNMSKRIDIPHGRISSWLRGSQPRGYESYKQAESFGWFDLEWRGDTFTGLNELVAWSLSGGSISQTYTPVFSVDEDSAPVCERALEMVGFDDHSQMRNDPRHRRSMEVRVHDHQTVLGRMLLALGVPKGEKTKQRYGLPPYLGPAPEFVRRRFAEVYLLNRLVYRDERGGGIVREERDRAYIEALQGLFQSLTDGTVSVSGEHRIQFDDQALSEFGIVSESP